MTSETNAWTKKEHLRGAIGFLTPVGPGTTHPTPESMTYFPLVGFGLGALLGALWKRTRRSWGALPAAVLVVAADAVATGALHLDGLSDAADGLLAHAPRKSRLEIMAEPDLGSFGAVTLGMTLAMRTAALAETSPSPALLGSIWCMSRSMMVLGSRFFGPYLRSEEGGLASSFLLDTDEGTVDPAVRAAFIGVGLSAALALLTKKRSGIEAITVGAIAGAGTLSFSRKRIGGFTGDVLGAAGVVAETVALMAAARKRTALRRLRSN